MAPICFFVTDLHGLVNRYDKLFAAITSERPDAVFLGGDLLPHSGGLRLDPNYTDFVDDYLVPSFTKLRSVLGDAYPDIFLILGNDDPGCEEEALLAGSTQELWHYVHNRKAEIGAFSVYGYSCVPPTPFLLKDWERYDVSRYVPPGSVSPEEGHRTVPVEESEIKWGTIQKDLESLVGDDVLEHAVFLFHTPPYDTALDRAALDGRIYEHVPLDLHVGSIAVSRFIEQRQPLLTLHGHVHESTRLTGEWKIRIGTTCSINGAHDRDELALVRFNLETPWEATRQLL